MTLFPSMPLTSRTWLLSASAILVVGLTACSQGSQTQTDERNAPAETSDASIDSAIAEDGAVEAQSMTEETADVEMEESEGEVRQVGSHVHGVANLAMALDGSALTIELDSPFYNIVGFEHAPENEAQEAAVKLAETVLSDPTALFRFNDEAECQADRADPIQLMAESGHDHDEDHAHDHDDDHDHGNDDHNEDHSHDHEDHSHDEAHDHEDDNHGHDQEEHDHDHKDASLSFGFTCQSPDSLQWVETVLFDAFENLEEIELVYLGPSTQMSQNLTSETGRITLN